MNRVSSLVLVLAASLIVATGVWVPWKAKGSLAQCGEKDFIYSHTLTIDRPCGYWWAFGTPPVHPEVLFPDLTTSYVVRDSTRPKTPPPGYPYPPDWRPGAGWVVPAEPHFEFNIDTQRVYLQWVGIILVAGLIFAASRMSHTRGSTVLVSLTIWTMGLACATVNVTTSTPLCW